jgi:hypothetical protein
MKRRDMPTVAMPAKTTRKKGPGGSTYVYLTTRSYRNAAGKPTSDEAMIGKLAEDGAGLIPNQRYFEVFGITQPPMASAMSLGASAALLITAERLGVASLLAEAFPGMAGHMLTAAAYMADAGCVMAHVGDWCDECVAPVRLDSQSSSELFASIEARGRMEFFRHWIARVTEGDYIAYDVTSLSTYSGNIEDAEWGHNRDGDDLCQINLGMFLGELSRLPVYYATYQGSVLDKVHLPLIMEQASALGIRQVRFVFDRGFVTSENLAYVGKEHLSFITALPQSLLACKGLIADAGASRIASSRNALPADGLYALALQREVLGSPVHAHVFYSPQKRALEEAGLYAKVSRLEAELESLSSARGLPKKYRDLFTVKAGGKAQVASFARDFDKIDARLARAGYFVLATSDGSLSSADVLATYRRKDAIEKAFSGMKNQLDLRRMRTHSGQTTDGKLFCGFIALILHSAIREALNADRDTANMPVGTALRELRKLKRAIYPDGSLQHTAITKTQRTILKPLGIEPESLLDFK